MGGHNKLYIYDASSKIDSKQAAGRFDDSGIVTLAPRSISELTQMLASLVVRKQTFKRALFQTHGNSGQIFFNGEGLDASKLRLGFTLFGMLFPHRAKLYFDGCNVADGSAGWDFLKAATEVFLYNAGGIAMAWTSLGSGMPGWLPFVGGHTLHLWGGIRVLECGPRSVETFRYDGDDWHPAWDQERVKLMQKLKGF